MDESQREVLISKRVELVENLDMTGGLYTQLLAKKIVNQRKVNEFKLQRTPEAQAEELLSFLPKRDCFDSFCEALIADGQEDIVKKYLKPPSKTQPLNKNTTEPCANSQEQTSLHFAHQEQRQEGVSSDFSGRETPDCASAAPSKKRPVHLHHPSSPPPAVLCIKESDEKHVYIKYDNPPSPAKRQRSQMDSNLAGVVMPFNGDNNTRYALKHYVSNEDEAVDSGGKSLLLHQNSALNRPHVMVLNNLQSVSENRNISDPSRYLAAFAPQMAEKPYENSVRLQTPVPSIKSTPSSPFKLKEPVNENDNTQITIDKFGARDRTSYVSGRNSQSLFQTLEQNKTTSDSSPLKKASYFSADIQQSKIQFMDPQQYLSHNGVLPSTKGASVSIENRNQIFDSTTAYKGDSLDTMCPPHSQYGLFQTDISAGDYLQVNTKAFEEKSPELEIDLPDGCVNVKVEHSTRQFFMSNYKKSYPMSKIPRGLALVINVDEVEGKPPRKGTNFDRDNLCNLLTQLHFNIVVYNDNDGLSAQEMVNKLKNFAKLKEHKNYDACFICLLSHGEEGYIFGTDGKRIPLEEIFMLFGNTNCKGLMGKPKVFIIQACRGGTLDKGVRMDEPDGGSIPAKGPINQQLPSMSDMLICYPTLMGYYAWRNRARGSWYIEAIVQVFMRYAKNEDICAMLNRVNQVVSRKVSECNQKEMNQMSQMSEYKSTLRQPHLYLFPGIGCSALQH